MVRTEKPQKHSGQLFNIKKLLVARSLKRIQQRYQRDRSVRQLQPMLLAELRRQKIPYQILAETGHLNNQQILCFGWLLIIITTTRTSETNAIINMKNMLNTGKWHSGFLLSASADALTILSVDGL